MKWRKRVAVAVAAATIYALSIGPADRMVSTDPEFETPSEEVFSAVYAPMFLVCKICRPIRKVAFWYVSLWDSSVNRANSN